MLGNRQSGTLGLVAFGVAIGLAIGGALACGFMLGRRTTEAAGAPALGGLRLQAMASHGSDSFAIATGPVDEEVEGLYTLDFLTGDLQCFVINPRTLKVGGWFKINVAKELPPEGSKKPHYLLATGRFVAPAGANNQRPAGCICYVVDANSGNVVAYTFPWNRSALNQGETQATEMRSLGKWKSRSVNLRD